MRYKDRSPVLEAFAVLKVEQMMLGNAADAMKDDVEGTRRRQWSHLIITTASRMLAIISQRQCSFRLYFTEEEIEV